MSDRFSRRVFLGKGAAAGLSLATAGSLAELARAATLAKAGDRPYPALAAGTESIPQIQHIVVLMMENHSFDNHFGALTRRGVDGLALNANGKSRYSNPAPGGRTYVTAASSTCQAGSTISQSWDASHQAWNNGRNDGFIKACGPVSMTYNTAAQLPYYSALASTFPVCDRYFASVMAQTYPNRRFLLAGSAFGQVGDPLPTPSDPNPRPSGFGTVLDMLNAFGTRSLATDPVGSGTCQAPAGFKIRT
jgi:phospholipase C